MHNQRVLTLRRALLRMLYPMAVALPLWISVGRGIAGYGGWLELYYTFAWAPLLLIALVGVSRAMRRPGVLESGAVGDLDAGLLLLLYLAVFLHGAFVVDFGDTPESLGSVATRYLGRGFTDRSTALAHVTLVASLLLLALALVVAVVERLRDASPPELPHRAGGRRDIY
jgi:hypothetical protein